MGMKTVIDGEYTILRLAKGKVDDVPIEVTLKESNDAWEYWVMIDRTDDTYGYSPNVFLGSWMFKFLDRLALKRASKYFDELVEQYKLSEEKP